MKNGRRRDHLWQLVKYKGSVTIYAKCSCGFRYECYERIGNEVLIPEKLYRYCPWCGSRKTKYTATVKNIDEFPWEWRDFNGTIS